MAFLLIRPELVLVLVDMRGLQFAGPVFFFGSAGLIKSIRWNLIAALIETDVLIILTNGEKILETAHISLIAEESLDYI